MITCIHFHRKDSFGEICCQLGVSSCKFSVSVSVSVAHLSSHNFNISPAKHNGTSCMPFPLTSIVTCQGPLLTVYIPCACFPLAYPALLFHFLVISCHVHSHSHLLPRWLLEVRQAGPRRILLLELC
jgi:hypothetical protein